MPRREPQEVALAKFYVYEQNESKLGGVPVQYEDGTAGNKGLAYVLMSKVQAQYWLDQGKIGMSPKEPTAPLPRGAKQVAPAGPLETKSDPVEEEQQPGDQRKTRRR